MFGRGLRRQSLRSHPLYSAQALGSRVTIPRDPGVSPVFRLQHPALRACCGRGGKEGNTRALIYNTRNTSATSESPELTSSHVNRDTHLKQGREPQKHYQGTHSCRSAVNSHRRLAGQVRRTCLSRRLKLPTHRSHTGLLHHGLTKPASQCPINSFATKAVHTFCI